MSIPEKPKQQPTFIEQLSQRDYAEIGAVTLVAIVIVLGVCNTVQKSNVQKGEQPTPSSIPLNRNTTSVK